VEFRKCLTNVGSQPLDFCRINLGLEVANFDALEGGQPRAEENEAAQKERRRIDGNGSDAEAVYCEQQAGDDYPEPSEVPEHKLPESIHLETARMINVA
jgi:hypothetical protein